MFFLYFLVLFLRPGATNLLNGLIADENEITVISSFPRNIAVAALRKAQISPLLEGRVSPDNLVNPLGMPPNLGERVTPEQIAIANNDRAQHITRAHIFERDGTILLKSCGLMRKPVMLTTLISGNRRSILSAKRLGLSVLGIQGYSEALHELRMADKLVPSLEKVDVKEFYKVRRPIMQNPESLFNSPVCFKLMHI